MVFALFSNHGGSRSSPPTVQNYVERGRKISRFQLQVTNTGRLSFSITNFKTFPILGVMLCGEFVTVSRPGNHFMVQKPLPHKFWKRRITSKSSKDRFWHKSFDLTSFRIKKSLFNFRPHWEACLTFSNL